MMFARFVLFLCLTFVAIPDVLVIHSRNLHTAIKKLDKDYKEDDGDKASRAKLLWELILTRTKVRHKESRQPRPLRKSLKVYTLPLKVGLCKDQHPLCGSYALSGLCDWPGLFQDLHNIHETCAFSCGYCKKNLRNGEVDFVGANWNSP
ncbi:uncharacterized protein LOC111325915 [Stylophora pistillata]|uniref:uncharacterized protein LOC111325915 n=1 Tax=Stylophora pistillata TaxID=50429 RepID=UPI000C038D91|nr:uncharacterized protein LOC111325915 [Stylophora pistillata]